MPDITMCASETCPMRAECYRNPASGTKPSTHRQSWFAENPKIVPCPYFVLTYRKEAP